MDSKRSETPRTKRRRPLDPLNQQEAADLLGVTTRTLRRFEVEDGFPRRDDGQYDPAACVAWMRQRDRAQLEEQFQRPALMQARIRKMEAEASLAELKLADEQKRLMTVEDFERLSVKLFTDVKNALLIWPARMCDELASITDRKEVRRRLYRYITEEIFRYFREGAWDEEDAAEDAEPVAAAQTGT